MDILRKELEQFYLSQHLEDEILPLEEIVEVCRKAESLTEINNGTAVVTDSYRDHCHVYSGYFGLLMGYAQAHRSRFEANSSDEDIIYERIHPEDLVDKRLLEYEFFKFVDSKDVDEKERYVAKCQLRMKDYRGEYRKVDNSTQIIRLSPNGKVWLILCTYSLSLSNHASNGIMPGILDSLTGEQLFFSFQDKRREILTEREKEVLTLIKEGKPSKQIADILDISIHTVNRHRQNILEKLSVGNSVEAVTAATLMNLL